MCELRRLNFLGALLKVISSNITRERDETAVCPFFYAHFIELEHCKINYETDQASGFASNQHFTFGQTSPNNSESRYAFKSSSESQTE